MSIDELYNSLKVWVDSKIEFGTKRKFTED
jgi:hypothetical protein